jgi:DNA polymerase-3 subunit gamma/tau
MSYLALARKWRPRAFSQLVGQEHINKALINSLNQQRLHHAYLFTGTRGVGKTSMARLFAKALNCEEGISASPCLQCEACLAIEQNRFLDLIEIDAASKTRVEDTRELLENVPYAPANGRFKIYLIDEVHMLSNHSFNALLKTLEEPPSHVKFLLATTDPQKLPVTILSRCIQFHLKHLSEELIHQQLKTILNEEKIVFEEAALQILAKAAKGSMRDALSLLDQVIACCEGNLCTQEMKAILGYTREDYAVQLLEGLADLNPQQLIQISRQIAMEGGHFRYVLDQLLNDLHQISICQNLPIDSPFIDSRADIKSLAKAFSLQDAQLFYQIALKGTEEMHLAPTLAIGFEMILLRMLTFKPAPAAPIPKLAYEIVQEKALGSESKEFITPLNPNVEANTTESLEMHEIYSPKSSLKQEKPSAKTEDWSQIIKQLKLTGLAINAAENAEFLEKSGRNITLQVAKGHQSLFTPAVLSRIEKALGSYYKDNIKILLETNEVISSPAQQKQIGESQRQQKAEISLQQDSFFQQLKQEFSAELVKNSIVAVEDEL